MTANSKIQKKTSPVITLHMKPNPRDLHFLLFVLLMPIVILVAVWTFVAIGTKFLLELMSLVLVLLQLFVHFLLHIMSITTLTTLMTINSINMIKTIYTIDSFKVETVSIFFANFGHFLKCII